VVKDEKNKDMIDRIWGFFSSIKLAVVVFSLISLTSIVGTIIEQQARPERNIKLLTKFFGENSAPSVFHILDTLGFTDMFHSWWFMSFLFIFAANLIVCSIDRLPKIWKVAKEPIGPATPEKMNTFSAKKETVLKEKVDSVSERVRSVLKKNGFAAAVQQESGATQLYAEKGRYSRLGVFVTHMSILMILAGAVIGMLFGFNATLNLPEGDASAVAYKSNAAEIPLGFEIRCDKFNVSFYENTDTPKAYQSWLTVMEGDREIMKKVIDVNSPLRYKGITFYQSSYGFSPNKDAVFQFTVTSNSGTKENVNVKFGGSFVIPGTAVSGKVIDFSPAIAVDESGKPYTYAEMMLNPAVFVEFSDNGVAKYGRWILTRVPQTWKVADGIVEFQHLWGAQYTGLQVRKDPGVSIVYLGCLIMAVGLYTSFFKSHERVWIYIKDERGGVRVVIAGLANKNKLAFEQKIDKIAKEIRAWKNMGHGTIL
jgi:cytochrome c biogenesis protein